MSAGSNFMPSAMVRDDDGCFGTGGGDGDDGGGGSGDGGGGGSGVLNADGTVSSSVSAAPYCSRWPVVPVVQQEQHKRRAIVESVIKIK